MIPSFLMFLAPGNPTQATPTSPQRESRFPAPGYAERRLHSTALKGLPVPLVEFIPHRKCLKKDSIKFGATVLGNAIGCGAIFAACWFSLQLMQVLMIP